MPGERRKIHKQIIFAYLTVPLIYFLDRLSKLFILELMSQGESISVIKNIFHITLVYNTGAAFGIFRSRPEFFVVIAVLAVFFINYLLLRKTHVLNAIERIGLCFILAGTLGNLTDRLRFGHVIDFLDFRVWPVFNLADSFITIGAVMLGVSIFVIGRGRK